VALFDRLEWSVVREVRLDADSGEIIGAVPSITTIAGLRATGRLCYIGPRPGSPPPGLVS
jgi:hypothetical protein